MFIYFLLYIELNIIFQFPNQRNANYLQLSTLEPFNDVLSKFYKFSLKRINFRSSLFKVIINDKMCDNSPALFTVGITAISLDHISRFQCFQLIKTNKSKNASLPSFIFNPRLNWYCKNKPGFQPKTEWCSELYFLLKIGKEGKRSVAGKNGEEGAKEKGRRERDRW